VAVRTVQIPTNLPNRCSQFRYQQRKNLAAESEITPTRGEEAGEPLRKAINAWHKDGVDGFDFDELPQSSGSFDDRMISE